MRILRRDWFIVGLFVATAALSLYAFREANAFAERASDRQSAELAAEAESSRSLALFQGLVDHDLRTIAEYCAASGLRDEAVVSVFQGVPGSTRTLVTNALVADRLFGLLQADTPPSCADASAGQGVDALSYSVSRGLQIQALEDPTFPLHSTGKTSQLAEEASRSERRLLLAALAFAVVLLMLTAFELARDRHPEVADDEAPTTHGRPTMWALAALATYAVGAAMVLVEAQPSSLLVAGLGLGAVAIVTLPALWRWMRRTPGPSERDSDRAARRAKLAGAGLAIAAAGAALGLALATGEQRDARSTAERLDGRSEQLMETGLQQGLRDLATVRELVELDARSAAANQLLAAGEVLAGVDTGGIDVARNAVEAHDRSTEPSARELLDGRSASSAERRLCPAGEATAGGQAASLLRDSRTDPALFRKHVAASGVAGAACGELASLAHAAAAHWGNQTKALALVVVILGLAGFLFAARAEDEKRRDDTNRWLWRMGIAGTIVGALVAIAPTRAIFNDRGTTFEADSGFAADAAAGDLAVRTGDCETGRERLEEADRKHSGHASVLLDLAAASMCTSGEEWLVQPSLDHKRLADAASYLGAAQDAGATEPWVAADIAWVEVLSQLDGRTPDRGALGRAAGSMEEALREMSDEGQAASYFVRFNLALTHLAMGESDAVQLYKRGLECLGAEADCDGGDALSLHAQRVLRIIALADLELLRDAAPEQVDDARQVLIGGPPSGFDDSRSGSFDLSTFPQELLLAGEVPRDDVGTQVAWYYRAPDADGWSVMLSMTYASLDPGANVNQLHPASQLLPEGDYRADVYQDGRKIGTATTDHSVPANLVRRSHPELGVSVAVPRDWTPSELYGVQVTYRSSDDPAVWVSLKRSTGADAGADPTASLDPVLDGWVQGEIQGGAGGPEPVPGQSWFLRGENFIVRYYPESQVWAAAYYAAYATAGCGAGEIYMAMLHGTPEEADAIVRSLVLEAPPFQVPDVESRYVSGGFSVDVPDGWPAAAGHGLFRLAAHQCDREVNLVATVEPAFGAATLDDYLTQYRMVLPSNFPGIDVEGDVAVTLRSGQSARDLTFTHITQGLPVRQTQRLMLVGDEVYAVTVTRRTERGTAYDVLVYQLLDSIAISGS